MSRRRVLHRPSEVKEPFTSDQKSRLLAEARGMGTVDGTDILRLVEFFLATGAHTALLYQASFYQPHIEGEYLCYTRPKNEKPIQFPLPKGILPWIDDFLGTEFPGSRWWYSRLLKRLAGRCGFPTNFLRFRHYAVMYALTVLGMSVPDVCRLFGVTPETCQLYGVRPVAQIAASMREKGW